ncbi:MAG: GntR family transcriptional regulator [Phycisphaeraceae bacterium]|nr:GntR family transcriptional regulator [Phycisphaeraceae bacterium]
MPADTRERRRNLKNRAYRFLVQELIAGNLPAGSRVSEIRIAQKASISRTPIREAFRKLESMGLLEQIPNRGVFVKSLSTEEYEDMLDLRELLEGFAARKAAARITPSEIARLETCCHVHLELAFEARKTRSDKLDLHQILQSLEADATFHKTILDSSDCTQLISIMDNLSIASLVLARLIPEDLDQNPAERYERVYREHSQIVDALRRADSNEACRLAMEHIHRKKQYVLARYHREKQSVGAPAPDHQELFQHLSNQFLKSVI